MLTSLFYIDEVKIKITETATSWVFHPRESLREDRLFNDPWAVALAGTEGMERAEHRSGDYGASIAIRTRFFETSCEKDADFGRWPYPTIPRALPGMPHNRYVTAQKKEK